ncbi:MAG: sugar kinase [Ktedonobacteraceae bacterium]|nr:sugar kinase [Ktedonobacteraceae bacterium]
MTRVVTLGEILLRLKSPQFERLFQSPLLEATFGGGEANVAVSLARFGLDAAFVTMLPNNPIGEAAVAELRRQGVDISLMVRGGERVGIYFLETGANQRPSIVLYDRSHSSIAEADPGLFDWETIFKGADWFHLSGITPALSQSAANLSLQAVQAAKQRGVTVSCDYNYRGKLWKYGRSAPEVMRDLVRSIDVGIAGGEDCQHAVGVTIEGEKDRAQAAPGEIPLARYEALCRNMFAAFPNLKYQAITLRKSHSASHNEWSACLFNGRTFFASTTYELTHIVDRVGTGDSFAAGLIYGLATGMGEQEALNFAVAASALKHTIPGDLNLVTFAEVQHLISGDITGRVQR